MDWRAAALVGILAGAGPVAAQSPIAITSRVETGWTSNAMDSAAGSADFYATHSQEATLTGATDNFVLRGSLAISQTRFMQTSFEDDDEVSGSLEVEVGLGDAAVLRLGYGVARSWSGDDLSIGGLAIPIRSDEIHHTYAAELVVAGTDQQVTVGVDANQIMPGDTVLVGLGLPAVRLTPEVGSVAVRVSWERALTPTLAALAEMEGWFTTIPDAQQLTFLRAPADGGRVAAGLRMMAGMVSIEASGGLDAVWPKGGAALLESAPYFAMTAGLTPVPELTLALKTETGVELVDPLDGVAGRTGAVELGAAWALRPELTLSAKLFARVGNGLFRPRPEPVHTHGKPGCEPGDLGSSGL